MRISDWSSDVCSSDLISKAVDAEGLAAGAFDLVGPAGIIANPRQGETARIARLRRAAFERRHLQQLRRVGFDQVGNAKQAAASPPGAEVLPCLLSGTLLAPSGADFGRAADGYFGSRFSGPQPYIPPRAGARVAYVR